MSNVADSVSDGVSVTPTAPLRAKPRKLAGIVAAAIAALAVMGFAIQAGGNKAAALPPGVLRGVAVDVDGNVKELLVKEGDLVKEGQLIAVIDDANYVAALDQARAEYSAIAAEANAGGVAVAVPIPEEFLGGRIVKNGGFSSDSIPSPGPSRLHENLPAVGATKDFEKPVDLKDQQKALDDTAKAVKSATEKRDAVLNDINSATAARDDAQRRFENAQKSMQASEMVLERTKREREKMSMLLAQGAVAAKDASRAEVAYQSATGAYNSLKATADAATSAVQAQEEALKRLATDLKAAEDAIRAAEAGASNAQRSLEDAKKRKPLTTAALAPEPSPPTFTRRTSQKPSFVQMDGPISSKESNAPTPVEIDKPAKREADMKMLDAKAKIDAAELALERTKIYATKTGRIYSLHVKVGESVKAGRVVAMIR